MTALSAAPAHLPDGRWKALLLASFVALASLALFHHEMWRDEWEYWEHARGNPRFGAFLDRVTGLGHPLLWPVTLWLLGWLGSHPAAMQVAHLTLATATVALVLWRSPFTRLQKALFCFGYYPLFEYAVISRSYAMGALWVAVLCVVYPHAGRKRATVALLLVLLPHTNAHAAIAAAAFLVALAIDGGRRRAGNRLPARPATLAAWFLACAGGVLSAAWVAVPPPGGEYAPAWRTRVEWWAVAQALGGLWRGLAPVPDLGGLHFWNTGLLQRWPAAEAALGGAALVAGAAALRRCPSAAGLWTAGATALLAFSYLYNPYRDNVGFARHHGHYFLLLLAAGWIARRRVPLLTGLLAVNAAAGLHAVAMDIAHPFSGSAEAAALIRGHGLQDLPALGDIDHATAAVASCLGRTAYFPARAVRGERVRRRHVSEDELRRETAWLTAARGSDVLLVVTYPLLPPHPFEEVAAVERSVVASERYWIYVARRAAMARLLQGELDGVELVAADEVVPLALGEARAGQQAPPRADGPRQPRD